MPRPAIDWVITDTHFYHDATIEWCGRPKDYNELIIKNLRYFLAPQDTLWHLGDVIFKKHKELPKLLGRVECSSKFLLRGNHDRKSAKWYKDHGFDGVFDQVVLGEFILSHKPVRVIPDGVRFNVHGHFHNTDHRSMEPEYNAWYDPEVHKLVAIEWTDYKPVRLGDCPDLTRYPPLRQGSGREGDDLVTDESLRCGGPTMHYRWESRFFGTHEYI